MRQQKLCLLQTFSSRAWSYFASGPDIAPLLHSQTDPFKWDAAFFHPEILLLWTWFTCNKYFQIQKHLQIKKKVLTKECYRADHLFYARRFQRKTDLCINWFICIKGELYLKTQFCLFLNSHCTVSSNKLISPSICKQFVCYSTEICQDFVWPLITWIWELENKYGNVKIANHAYHKEQEYKGAI